MLTICRMGLISLVALSGATRATDWGSGGGSSAEADATAQSESVSVVSTNVDVPRLRYVIGGAGMSSYANITADCVGPKLNRKGRVGFFKRGANFLGIFGIDRALEVDIACVTRAESRFSRQMAIEELRAEAEMLRARAEADRAATERMRAECDECGVK